jgi:hypothetical protein
MKFVPIYQIRHWRCTTGRSGTLRYRPTLRNLLTRFFWTALCALLIVAVEWAYRDTFSGQAPVSPTQTERENIAEMERDLATATRELVGDEAFVEIERDMAATRSAPVAKALLARIIDYVRWGVVGFLALVGVLVPLSWLWNRLGISVTPQGELEVSSWFFLPRRRRWDVTALGPIRTLVMERFSYSRRGRLEYHHWEWIVQIPLQGAHGMPFSGGLDIAFQSMGPQFNVYCEKQRPSLVGRAPEPVREIVKGLRGLTGLDAEVPQVVEGRRTGPRGRGVTHTLSHSVENVQPVVRSDHFFRNDEEIPEQIRAQFRAMAGDREDMTPDGIRRIVKNDIVVRDAEGNETTYRSVDDLPDEVRRRLGL